MTLQPRCLPLLAAALVAIVSVGCASSNTDIEEGLSMTDASVDSTLNSFHAAAANADFDRYFASWSNQSVFLGTDATERWEGDQFKDFAQPYFQKGQGWSYLPRARRISMSVDGKTAWFDELLDHEKYGTCRGSGVLLRNPGATETGWTIVQYNLSIPIPNDLATEFTTRIKSRPAPAK